MKVNKLFRKLILTLGTVVLLVPVISSSLTASASEGRSYGIDESRYQGYTTYKRYNQDEFAIAQIGGSQGGYIYDQATYNSQVSTGIANGLRMHTYIWDQTGSSIYQTDRMLDYFLPKIQTPKGSIVALDYEAGASGDIQANTNNIIHGMQRIKDAGYTPIYYSYKPYTLAHVDWNRVNQAFPNSGWIAAYSDYQVRTQPYWGVFPSMDGVTMYQFTSTYANGGLDGNISLAPNGLDVTKNGYRQGNSQKADTHTPAVDRGEQIHQDTHNYVVKSGDSWWKIANDHGMDMYALAKLNGSTINSVIYPGQVLRVADKGEGNSVSNKVQKPVPSANTQQTSTYTVRYGDSWWKIANDHGMSMYTLAQINGKSIYNTIYPGQVLKISGNAQVQQRKSYTVRYGDNLSTIAYRLGTSVNHLVATNGLRNANLIYPGQVLSY